MTLTLAGTPGKLSSNTVHHHHRLLSSMCNDAVQWQVIPTSPAARVKPPSVTKRRAACHDESQIKTLLAALAGEEL